MSKYYYKQFSHDQQENSHKCIKDVYIKTRVVVNDVRAWLDSNLPTHKQYNQANIVLGMDFVFHTTGRLRLLFSMHAALDIRNYCFW